MIPARQLEVAKRFVLANFLIRDCVNLLFANLKEQAECDQEFVIRGKALVSDVPVDHQKTKEISRHHRCYRAC